MSKNAAAKKIKKGSQKQARSLSVDINDIIKKVEACQQEADKKLAELSNYCLAKDCKVKI